MPRNYALNPTLRRLFKVRSYVFVKLMTCDQARDDNARVEIYPRGFNHLPVPVSRVQDLVQLFVSPLTDLPNRFSRILLYTSATIHEQTVTLD